MNIKNNKIDASPTKDFFISILVKDIALIDAIIDLIDNSVDGALRLRQDDNFDGLWVRIEASGARFRISDNCGGFDIDIARDYAFRFGRPDGFPQIEHSIGQFGVGMKRALFKLGERFIIESKTSTTQFKIDTNVEEWKQKGEWEFEFVNVKRGIKVPSDNRGTTITVEPLHESIAEQFDLENVINKTRNEIEIAHQRNIEKKLAISLNQIPLSIRPLQLLQSDQLKPVNKELIVRKNNHPPVIIKIFSGLAESSPSEAGWYLFCNGRLIVEADKTDLTGWSAGEETKIPRYHNQFAQFRGYTFFDSDDAGLLPWNTTKTGVDESSPIYRAVLLEMINAMRPVIDFLNKLKEERDELESEQGILANEVKSATLFNLDDIEPRVKFSTPKPVKQKQGPQMARINYQKPKEQIEQVKKLLKLRTNRDVGEQTFDYFYGMEVED